MQCVRTVLSQGSADLDWEVKVYTLELAELLLDEAFAGHQSYRGSSGTHRALSHPYGVVSNPVFTLRTHTEGTEPDLVAALNNVVEQGVVSVLLCSLVDCDRPVGLKACQLLLRLRETVCPLDATGVSCELPDRGWGQEIRKMLDVKKHEGAGEAGISAQGSFNRADCRDDGGGLKEGASEGGSGETVGVCELLRSLGLDERLETLTRSSDHVHNSPLSLLQDIMSASAAHTRPDTQPGQEVIVDCY